MNEQLFKTNPRDYALQMVSDGLVAPEAMIQALLAQMSHNDIRCALDANELSPRFNEATDEQD